MTGEVAAILLLVVVHVAAIGVLVWVMVDGDAADWRGWWPHDERPDQPSPRPNPPLADAVPARVRLRGPGRVAKRSRRRRGEHAPQPARTRDPA